MSAYRGHLTTVVGDGPEVVIKLSGQLVQVLTPDGKVHSWPSEDVRVTGISGNRFWIAFSGEIAVFSPEEPESFMLEFLPGLKAARTVADAIAATQPLSDLAESNDRDSWTPDGGPRSAQETAITDPPPLEPPSRKHVVAHRPHLPQLAEHIQANSNGDALMTQAIPLAEEDNEPKRRWWNRSEPDTCSHDWEQISDEGQFFRVCTNCGAQDALASPSLRRQPHAAPAEQVKIDLSDEAIDSEDLTISTAVGGADRDRESAPDQDGPGLLRSLADRNQAFEEDRRGSYRPRR